MKKLKPIDYIGILVAIAFMSICIYVFSNGVPDSNTESVFMFFIWILGCFFSAILIALCLVGTIWLLVRNLPDNK